MTRPISLTVACPAFNEEEAIERVVRDCLAKIPTMVEDFEILVVDDGSTDRTPEILARLAAEDPHVRVITHPRNLGFGGFARSLINNASKQAYVGISGDGEVDIESLERMLQALTDGADVVVAVRTQKPNYSPFRKLVSFAYNRSVALAFGTDFRDIGGPKMWRTTAIRTKPPISNSAFLNAELLVRARRAGARVGFVETVQRPRMGGKPKGASTRWIVGSVRDLVRVWLDVRRSSGGAER